VSTRARRLRRRRLLALPVVLVLLALSLKLVTMSWFSTRGASAYGDSRYAASEAEFDRLQFVNVIEPWRAYLGSGTALHRQGDLAAAEAAFRRALELAPERCDVRFNLTVTIEAQGDILTGGNQRAVEDTDRENGLARYRIALDIADAGVCPEVTAGEAGPRLDETRARLRIKLGAETVGDTQELELPDDENEGQQGGEEQADSEQQIAARNQTGAGRREDFSDLDPSQVQDQGTSDW
jgi:tetratricopeptide (TPR) repeat protein